MTQSGINLRNNNLQDLQVQSVKLLAGLLSVVAYGWLMWIIWPESEAARPATWTVGLVMLAGAGLAYLLHRRWLVASSWLLVGCTLVGVAAAEVACGTPEIAYFLALPVIMASLLLSPAGLAIVVVAAVGLGLGTAALLKVSLASAGLWLPLVLILLVALAYWFGARSLYLALQWMWTGYEEADRNERLATERQAKLRQVLKSLDEALFSLERANQMLAQARDEAVEARRMKQQFAQTISHELRTPLNLIVGFTELMTQSPEYYGAPPAPAYLRDLTIVYRNARHLQDLVTDVLDLARIEAAEMTIVPEHIDPGEMVNEAIHTARGLVEARGLALRVDVEPGLPRLWVDATRVRQVLINLLNNAVRFTERGTISLSVRRSGADVEFAVKDTGVGIPPEHLGHIFDEFRQVDGSTRRSHGGVGLGLAISRRFVELHHGHIWAQSEVGKGSIFYFALPVGRPDGLEPSKDMLRLASPPQAESKDRILLVVTRSPAAAGLLTRYARGVRTVVFPDLEAARTAAFRLLPQGIIVDTNAVPLTLDGMQALAQSLGLPGTGLLAGTLPGEAAVSRQLQVDGYLAKPVSRADLWDTLRPIGERVDRVLLVDDDRDFVRLLTRMLDNPVRRYEVLSADSGTKGLDMLAHHVPDLVLLDMGLPDMDGLQFLERMRTHPEWRDIRVVVVSGQDEMSSLEGIGRPLMLTRSGGLSAADLVQWAQVLVGAEDHRKT